MENLLIRVPIDKLDKKEIITSFLRKLGIKFSFDGPDWIEPEPFDEEDIFAETFGMWANTDITIDSIRRKAWRRE